MKEDKPPPEHPTSTYSIDTVSAAASITAKKRPSLRVNFRLVMAAYELLGCEVKDRADGCPAMPDPDHRVADGEPSPEVSPRMGKSPDTAQQEICNEDGAKKEVLGVSDSEGFADAAGEDKYESTRQDLNAGEVREIAAQALAAIPEEDKSIPHPLTPRPQVFQRELIPTPQQSSSLHMMSPPHSQARSPLRSPCWRTLVPVTSQSGGYWTPSATVEGEKNTPMCPPCRSGKKGRCFGGLPCDRCRDKGYIKERCEGSLVFRFSPKKKVVRDQTEAGGQKELPVDSGRWKRDAFGRFT